MVHCLQHGSVAHAMSEQPDEEVGVVAVAFRQVVPAEDAGFVPVRHSHSLLWTPGWAPTTDKTQQHPFCGVRVLACCLLGVTSQATTPRLPAKATIIEQGKLSGVEGVLTDVEVVIYTG